MDGRPFRERLFDIVDRTCGDTAIGCRDCRKIRRDATGVSACSQTQSGECKLGPMPHPDPQSLPALELFLCLQSRWETNAMTGRRMGIPRTELEIEARARGIALCEFLLDDFKAMELLIVNQDIERVASQSENN